MPGDMTLPALPRSIWEGVSCHTDRDRDAIRSWFNGLADGMNGPLKANILTRTSDDRSLKIRALFETADGRQKEIVRTMGKRFTITIREPTTQRWV